MIRSLTLIMVLLCEIPLFAQSGRVPEEGGLIIYKTQAFYGNNMAEAMLFTKAIPRGPTSTLYIGLGGQSAAVPSDGELGTFTPEDINVTNLSSGAALDKYRGAMGKIQQLSQLSANVANTVAPILEKMRSNIAMVEGGSVLVGGEWKVNPNATPTPIQRELKQAHLKSLTTIDGDTYRNATYKSSDDKKVSFSHADGVARVPWDNLKRDDQLSWGYDAEKIKAEKLAREKAAEEETEKKLAQVKANEEALKKTKNLAEEKARADALAQKKSKTEQESKESQAIENENRLADNQKTNNSTYLSSTGDDSKSVLKVKIKKIKEALITFEKTNFNQFSPEMHKASQSVILKINQIIKELETEPNADNVQRVYQDHGNFSSSKEVSDVKLTGLFPDEMLTLLEDAYQCYAQVAQEGPKIKHEEQEIAESHQREINADEKLGKTPLHVGNTLYGPNIIGIAIGMDIRTAIDNINKNIDADKFTLGKPQAITTQVNKTSYRILILTNPKNIVKPIWGASSEGKQMSVGEIYAGQNARIWKIALDEEVVENIFNTRKLSSTDFIKMFISQYNIGDMHYVNDGHGWSHYEGMAKDGSVNVAITSDKQLVINAMTDLND